LIILSDIIIVYINSLFFLRWFIPSYGLVWLAFIAVLVLGLIGLPSGNNGVFALWMCQGFDEDYECKWAGTQNNLTIALIACISWLLWVSG